ncbi:MULTISPECIES: hypothetical protein [Streptomyces]|nr:MULTISPECIES: hypothetical protein [Streptomyces]
MIAVTTEDVEQAEALAEQAAGELREAERRYASNRASQTAYERHKAAVEVADQAAVRARLTRQDWEAHQAVRDLRAAEGEAAVREMADDIDGLATSRTAAVGAVAEAAAAMARALVALDAHDRLVRAAGAVLEKRGLRSRDGESTGVSLDGAARIGGELWPLVDGAGVLGHCLAEQVAGVYPRHPMARPAPGAYGGVSAAKGRDQVLALVRAARGR